MIIVQKFGGSSVADAERVRRVAQIIAKAKLRGDTPVAVLSAQGDTSDILIEKAHSFSPSPPRRELDALLSTGELSSVALMAMQLNTMGLDSISLSGRQAGIKTDGAFGNASIESIDCGRIKRELDRGRTVIVAGFQGISADDDVTTLGRGGSDTTAVALAAALGAGRCEIYSDVDGIYTADPRLVPEAYKLELVDHEDMLRLAQHGSQVLQARSVETAMRNGVDIELLSSFVKKSGTTVTHLDNRPAVCGVTRSLEDNSVSIVGSAVSAATLAQAEKILTQAGIGVHGSSIAQGVCSVAVDEEHSLPALRLLHGLVFS